MRYLLLMAMYFCLASQLFSQNKPYPRDYFQSPLDIPLYLSGNFAELRRNHFHTGIDIKTESREGLAIYAVAEGVISRINVSPYGYGKAIYIDHPNGYTTVYGHLSDYSERINTLIKEQQVKERSFAVDFTPDPARSEVTKGEQIASSGNTGGSGGPHLHFEIRDTETEEALNPMLFGFDIKDDIAPRIRGLRVYPIGDSSFVDAAQEAKSYVVAGSAGKYSLSGNPTISVYGTIGFAAHTIDFLNGYPNKCGIYTIELLVDSQLVFRSELEKISFATSRNINSYKDYEVYHKNNWHYHKSFKDPGNQLEIYTDLIGDGTIEMRDDKIHNCSYIIKDVYGNTSTFNFKIKALSGPPVDAAFKESSFDAYFAWDEDNTYTSDNISIDIPKGALYQDLKFKMLNSGRKPKTYSDYFVLQDDLTPLNKEINLKIKTIELPKELTEKALIVRYNRLGNAYYEGGTYENGFITGTTKSFGEFAVIVDNTAPLIQTVNISNGSTIKGKSSLTYKISDNFSGIKSINAFINGEWIVMDYEPKKAAISWKVDESLLKTGANTFLLEVIDNRDNKTILETEYTW